MPIAKVFIWVEKTPILLSRMVTLLRKLFIKNYHDVNNQKVRYAHGLVASLFGIITNIVLVILKLSAAVYSAYMNHWIFSMALIGDAINNTSDAASSIITLVGFKMSSKPADADHPFGHQRIEYIAGLVVAVFVIAAGLELGMSSVEKLISGETPVYDIVATVVMFVSVFLKIVQGLVNLGFGKAIDSPSLKATAIDSFTDSISTFVIATLALVSLFYPLEFLDGYLGLALAVLIAFSGIKMIKETSSPLIGQAADIKYVEQIKKAVLAHPSIKGVHDVICHSYGPTSIFISLHAEVDAKRDILSIHDEIDNIEEEIRKKFGVDITIHMDPVILDDPDTNKTKQKCIDILNKFDSSLTLHDFRMVKGDTHINVIFDVVVPYEDKASNEDNIRKALEDGFADEPIHHNFVLHLDHPFAE